MSQKCRRNSSFWERERKSWERIRGNHDPSHEDKVQMLVCAVGVVQLETIKNSYVIKLTVPAGTCPCDPAECRSRHPNSKSQANMISLSLLKGNICAELCTNSHNAISFGTFASLAAWCCTTKYIYLQGENGFFAFCKVGIHHKVI